VHILLIDSGGREQEGLLLAGGRDRMRVMIPGRPDAEELRLVEGDWMSERGAVMEIGAIAPISPGMRVVADEPLRAHAGAAF
jgi:hypothetical protein